MKIKQLIIENIASIVSATIDFDKAPLAGEPLFLITGDTGSGKTTILNSICLALYNTAPNLKNIPSPTEDNDKIQINNPRQFMRKGSTQCSISLSFEGNDNKNYVARWSVARAHKRISGNVMSVQRELECVETSVTCTKENDIKSLINDVVGLTFDEFCRTTMLAQGEFSKFMNSKDNEKAAILEKLTGTEIFAQVSKKIFELTKNKETEIRIIDAEIKSANLLSNEDIANFNEQISLLNVELKRFTTIKNSLDTQIEWLEKSSQLNQKLISAKRELQLLQSQLESSQTIEQQSTITAWNDTKEVRGTMNSVIKDNNTLSSHKKKRSSLENIYTKIGAGKEFLKLEYAKLSRSLTEVENLINEQQPNVAMYNAISEIENLINTINRNNQEISKLTNEIKTTQQEIDNKNSDLKENEKNIKLKETEISTLQKEKEELQNQNKDVDIELINKQIQDLHNKKEQYNTIRQKIENYREKQNEGLQLKQEIDDLTKEISKKEEIQAKNRTQLPQLQQTYQALENQYKGKLDLKNHIIELQQTFANSHTCPLCGSHVASIATAEILDSDVTLAKQEYEKALESFQLLDKSNNQLVAQLSEQKLSLIKKSSDYTTKTAITAKLQSETESLSNSLNINYLSDTVINDIENKINTITLQNNELSNTITKATGIQNSITIKDKNISSHQLQLANLQAKDKTIAELVTKYSTSLTLKTGEIENNRKTIVQTTTRLKEIITIEIDWNNQDLGLLHSTIATKANEYNTQIVTHEKLTKQIENLKNTINTVDNNLAQISNQIDSSTTIASAIEYNNIIENSRQLAIEITQNSTEIKVIENRINEGVQQINSYFETTTSYDRTYVKSLLKIAESTIQQYQQRIDHIKSQIATQTGAVQQLTTEQSELNQQRPTLPEVVDLVQLKQQQAENQTEIKSTETLIVKITTQLENNADNEKRVETKRNTLRTLQAQYNEWTSLNAMFGSSTGDKFRTIALSFILNTLLNKANHYMRMLSKRYLLQCTNSSLTINVIDTHQGDIVRNVGSLSGGESFIASLALALGLSSINQSKINVDTLFIDEGFGTLSQEYLEMVINTLDRLQQIGGRRVGVISHVAELRQRIPTQISVNRTGPSASSITVSTK